jgi:phosphoribosylformylglycinamidine cyclo-ligase
LKNIVMSTKLSSEPATGKTIEYAVDYDAVDPVKRLFQGLGAETSVPSGLGLEELPGCRGESVHIVRRGDLCFGSLIEGLGTRGLVADAIYNKTGISHYRSIGRSAAETIFNDLATSGIQPVACFMYLSAGSNEVFTDMRKMEDLGRGWQDACLAENAAWGGGETPMLRDLVSPGAFEIAGSTWGIMSAPQQPITSKSIREGDCIIGITSSGIHDNGLTLARDITTERLQELGYDTPIGGGQTFGQALMEPTMIYGPVIRKLRDMGIEIDAAVNITGHGLAKLARAEQPFDYVVEDLPDPHAVFPFIQKEAGLSAEKMYSKFNMGVGFAVITRKERAREVIETTESMIGKTSGRRTAWLLGSVEKAATGKKRVLLPNGIIFTEKDVAVR